MSVVGLRDGPLSVRRNERTLLVRRRASRLRALNAVTAALTQHIGLPVALQTDFYSEPTPPLSSEESRFLDDNDIDRGRYFRDASLPTVTIESLQRKATSSLSKQGQVSFDLPTPTTALPDSHPVAGSDAAVDGDHDPHEPGSAPARSSKVDLEEGAAVVKGDVQAGSLKRVENLDHDSREGSRTPIRTPKHTTRLNQHQAHDELTSLGTESAPAQEVVAPGSQERSRDNATSVGLGLQVDLVSSPSSTAGPQSATTPRAADPSPATSLDEEPPPPTARQVTASQSMGDLDLPDSVKPAEEIAVDDEPRDDSESPGGQLRMEQEQAEKAAQAARDLASSTRSDVAGDGKITDKHNIEAHDEQDRPSAAAVETSNASGEQPPLGRDAMVQKLSGTDTPQRMRTRVSSGVLRHKSVSEIISESSKHKSPDLGRVHQEQNDEQVRTPKSAHQTARARAMTAPSHHVSTTKVSEPIITDEAQPAFPAIKGGYAALREAAEDPNRDYLEPLYRIQAQDPPNGRSLGELLHKSSKAVTTQDQLACVQERQDYRILKRIYALQYANRWSLRQLEPYPELAPPTTHMDHLLAEMKWMRTDFREERKVKKAMGKYLAQQCAEWVHADADGRAALRVSYKHVEPSTELSTKEPNSPAVTNAGESGDFPESGEPPVPDLEPSAGDLDRSPGAEGDTPRTPAYAFVPGSLFGAMNITDQSYQLRDSEELAKAINELPVYAPFAETKNEQSNQPYRTESSAVPAVSKFSSTKLVATIPDLRKKRSRYDYEEDDDDQGPFAKHLRASEPSSGLAPEQDDVALFDPANKPIRDRLHANTAFRPPSEFPMPSTQFYEFRHASQWTWEDDQKLRTLAKDYCFNWSLIAEELSVRSLLHNAADRRTPWECFERWVELETLPNEMRKTIYFKTWAQRMETATRNVDARYQAQVHHHSQNGGQGQQPVRRRIQPMRVEKRRQTRYLHVVDAMRKLARKREQQAHKQAETQKAASLRKQHENVVPKSNTHTPQEFSRMRHERDVQIAVRQERYREAMLNQAKAAQMQRNGQVPNPQQVVAAGGVQQARPGSSGVSQMPNAQGQMVGQAQPMPTGNGQPQLSQQQQAAMAARNGHLAVQQTGGQPNGVPQVQMQANMRGGAAQGQGPLSATEILQRGSGHNPYTKETQMRYQQYQMQQQQQQHGNHSSPAPGQGANIAANNQMHNNAAATAAMRSAAGMQNGNVNSLQQNHAGHYGNNNNANPATSPMPPPSTPASQPQQLSSGHVPAITQLKHNLQAQHPQATPQQIDQMAGEQMRKHLQAAQARQNALNAASGSHGVISNGNVHANNTNGGANANYAQQNQAAYQHNQGMTPAHNNQHAQYNANNNPNNHQGQGQAINTAAFNNNNGTANANVNAAANASSPQTAQYSALMRQRLMQQQSQIQQTQNGTANVSPNMQHASPKMVHVSPNMAHVVPNMGGGGGVPIAGAGTNNNLSPMHNGQQQQGQRPPSRSATPQMVRLPSNGPGGSVGGMQSPALQQAQLQQQQGSPRPAAVRQ